MLISGLVCKVQHMIIKKCTEKARSSVAKGPIFRPQNSKGAPQKCVWPEKLAAEFSLNMPKKGRKGAELFEADYSYKNLKISAEKYTSSPKIFDFSVPLPKEIVCKRQ
jgi:hypothetical protein